MYGKGASWGLWLLILMVALIITLHYLSIHIHTDHHADSAHVAHNSLKTQALEASRRRSPVAELEKQLSMNSTLQQIHHDLLVLREKLRNNGFSSDPQSPVEQASKSMDQQRSEHVAKSPAQQAPPSTSLRTSSRPITSPAAPIRKKRKAVIFTMDTIPSYEENSRSGGASGELIIRYALEEAFKEFGVSLQILRSDAEFDACNADDYDIILLDSWTWAMKGWLPKRNIRGHEDKVYILDFFGSPKLRNFALSPRHILTAFKSPWNSFLGYYIHPERIEKLRSLWEKKKNQGVIWGKDPKHYDGKHALIAAAADTGARLISTSTVQVERHPNVEWVGHLTSAQWFGHLAQSKFLLGLGNPLLGPSAVDAVSLGCMFIDPIYKTPAHTAQYRSQHPYLHDVAPEYVCTYHEGNAEELTRCVEKALSVTLPPKIPDELTREAYFRRVQTIFDL
eukprot:gene16172-11567_t